MLVNVDLKVLAVLAGCIHGFKTGVFPKKYLVRKLERFLLTAIMSAILSNMQFSVL